MAEERKIELATHGRDIIETNSATGETSFREAVEDVGPGSMLGYRLQQQAALSNFGMEALQSRTMDELLHQAVETAAAGMRAGLAKILQYREAENDLLIRAGIGWAAGVVGRVSLGADLGSPAGYAYQTGSAVISNQLGTEDRFRTPMVMQEHGVRRAINVLIVQGGGRWGVLEVDSPNPGKFEAADLAFLQGLANFIGVALDRQGAEERLSEAIDYQKILVKEASHRVKNSLAMLAGLFRMKARSSGAPEAATAFADASDRVIAIARAHDRLWRESDTDTLDLGALLPDLCHVLNEQWPHIEVRCDVDAPMPIEPDRAAAFGLLLTELTTNAVKHAYDEGGGTVHVRLARENSRRLLEVRDEGVGLPEDFKTDQPSRGSLGMRLIQTLTQSVGGHLEISSAQGAVFRVWF